MASVVRRVYIQPRARSSSTSRDLCEENPGGIRAAGMNSMSNRQSAVDCPRRVPTVTSGRVFYLLVSRHKAVRARDSHQAV